MKTLAHPSKLLVAALAAALALGLIGCTSQADSATTQPEDETAQKEQTENTDPFLGHWPITGISTSGPSGISSVSTGDNYVEVKADGAFLISFSGQGDGTGTWAPLDEKGSYQFNCSNGNIFIVTLSEGDGQSALVLADAVNPNNIVICTR